MEFNVVNRIKACRVRPSAKCSNSPREISFRSAAGTPATEAFPADDIQRIVADVLQKKPVSMLQYGLSEGYPPLVATLKDRLAKTENMDFEKNDVLIVSGGQQAASLLCALLVDEGDVIITEDPSFVGCLNCFRCAGARLVGVPLEPDGMDITRLEEALKKKKRSALFTQSPASRTRRATRPAWRSAKKSMSWRKNTTPLFWRTTPTASCAFQATRFRPSNRWITTAASSMPEAFPKSSRRPCVSGTWSSTNP
jgi:2-aminoadipate transaminase